MEGRKITQLPNITRVRLWQMAENVKTPYVIASPQPLKGKLVTGRLNCIGTRGEVFILADMSGLSMEKAQILRVYTLHVEGGDSNPPPRDKEEIAQKKVLTLSRKMPVALRNVVSEIVGLPNPMNAADAIAENPDVINHLWESELFANTNIFVWDGDFNFGRSFLRGVRIFTIRDRGCIREAHCRQNPNLGLSDFSIIF